MPGNSKWGVSVFIFSLYRQVFTLNFILIKVFGKVCNGSLIWWQGCFLLHKISRSTQYLMWFLWLRFGGAVRQEIIDIHAPGLPPVIAGNWTVVFPHICLHCWRCFTFRAIWHKTKVTFVPKLNIYVSTSLQFYCNDTSTQPNFFYRHNKNKALFHKSNFYQYSHVWIYKTWAHSKKTHLFICLHSYTATYNTLHKAL